MSSSTNAIHFHCESCKYELAVPIELAGITGPCPNCGATITSPTLEEYERTKAPPLAATAVPEANIKGAIPPIRPKASTPNVVDVSSPMRDLKSKIAEESSNPSAPTESIDAEDVEEKYVVEDVARSRPQWDDTGEVGRILGRPPGRSYPQGRSKKWGSLVIALISLLVVMACMIIFYYQPLREKVMVYLERQRVEDKEQTIQKLEAAAGADEGERTLDTSAPGGTNHNAPSSLAAPVELSQDPVAPPAVTPSSEPSPTVESKASEIGSKPEAAENNSPKDSAMAPQVPTSPDGTSAPRKAEVAELSVKRAVPVDENPIPETEIVVEATPAVKDAVEAIKSFCAAKTWEERARFVQYEEEVKPMMKQYYEANGYRKVNLAYIELLHHEAKPSDGTAPHAVFNISGGGLEKPVPVMAEQHKDGWKIDWLAFTEFSEDLLERFMSDYVESTTRFRVMIRRKTFFGDGRLKAKDSFEVKSAFPGFEAYVFAEKGSPISEILNREVPWNRQPLAVIAELKWRQEGDLKWVEIVSLPQLNWKNRGPEVTKAEAVE